MKHPVVIGVVCLARKTFDYKAASQIYTDIKKQLENIENADFEYIDDLVIDVQDAEDAAKKLNSKMIDGLICISGTFHLGHLILEINKVLNKPILLWGLNELPYDGGKIRLNSVCGVNLNASNLFKAGFRNYHACVGDKVDKDWIDAVRINKAISISHIGLAGFRAHGFFNLGINDLNAYSKLGFLLDHYEISDIFSPDVEKEELGQAVSFIKKEFDIGELDENQTEKVASLIVNLRKFLDNNKLDALAIRCWPEFADNFGISPCAAMSVLGAENRILACEGDVEGAVSMIAHKAVGAETPFLADFSQVDLKNDYALLWHCGVAPCNLWDGKCSRTLDTYFAGGRGVTSGFAMKPGKVSILRIDSADNEYRIFTAQAEGQPTDKDLKGTFLKVRFKENINEVLNKIIYNGIAHHVSMAYGEFYNAIKIFARIKGWEIIE